MPGFYETILKAEGPLTAAWVIEGENAGARALRDSRGTIFRDGHFSPEESGARVFTERIAKGRRLVLCGAGHVALCVIRLAAMLGYGTTVIEDREEYARKAREVGAQRVICRDFGEALAEIPGDETTAFVVMTREHAHDVECLRRILPR